MAEMGLGYGSEYQLLRFLGHHRNELNQIIREQTRLKGELIWLDFPKDTSNKPRLSLDNEHKGISFLPQKDMLISVWNNYWTGDTQNWDAIIIHIENEQIEYVIVEAKANKEELKSNCQAKTESQSECKIKKAFDETRKTFGIETLNCWLKDYYQLANRLAFINFLHSQNIKASLLNIYFINGYVKRDLHTKELLDDKNVSKADWDKIIKDEYDYLGINDEAKIYISEIFVEC
jgi:hypothetical protein